MHCLMILQAFDGFRYAVALQVTRSSASNALISADAARHHGRILQISYANNAIDCFLYQINRAVSHADHQFDIRVALMKIAEFRDQNQASD